MMYVQNNIYLYILIFSTKKIYFLVKMIYALQMSKKFFMVSNGHSFLLFFVFIIINVCLNEIIENDKALCLIYS